METLPEGSKRNWEHTVLHPALGATSGAQSITCVLIPPPQAAMGQAASSQWGIPVLDSQLGPGLGTVLTCPGSESGRDSGLLCIVGPEHHHILSVGLQVAECG